MTFDKLHSACLQMLGGPSAPELRYRLRRYRIVGASAPALRASIAALGPRRGGVSYAGYTDWRLDWSHEAMQRGRLFEVHRVRVRLELDVTLPEWIAPSTAPAQLRAWWQRYSAALIEHELTHMRFAIEVARSLHFQIATLSHRGSAAEISAVVSTMGRRAVNDVQAHDRGLDQRTNHGEYDGVCAPEGAP